jgi:hypothetical protein
MDKWSKPELVVLVRSKPEEAVLGGCKVTAELGGPGATFASCVLLNDKQKCTLNVCQTTGTS